jgi:hypothetical protein
LKTGMGKTQQVYRATWGYLAEWKTKTRWVDGKTWNASLAGQDRRDLTRQGTMLGEEDDYRWRLFAR